MNDVNAVIRKLYARQSAMEKQMAEMAEYVKACSEVPRSITEEIDSIPGRRIWYMLNARDNFTAADAGLRGTDISITVSQDGPFIATHYPLVTWKPNLPATATNFGAWRPVSTWPLPDQVLDLDLVDLSYEIRDSGSQRNFQNDPTGPLFSRPDDLKPLPVPTLFAPNTVITFTPIFERIVFQGAVATTRGELYVGFPGYKVVNM